MPITIHDNFKLNRKHYLSGEDHYVLAQMYLPIIGIDSFSLYSLLFTLNDNNQYAYKKLIDALNFNSLNFLEKAFNKLEAVSLIESYYNEQKGYLYVLKTPLSTTSFLQNTLLSSFLTSQIGEIEVMKFKSENEKVNIKTYKNISKAFDDVYEVTNRNIENSFNKILKIKTKQSLKVINPAFDYIFFKMSFDSNFLDPKILDDEEFKQQILTISFNYKLTEEDMVEVIHQTITIDKDLKYSDISKNARIFFQQKNKNTEAKFVTKEVDAFISSQMDDDLFQFIHQIENMTPVDLLTGLSSIKPSVSELKIIEDLIKNTNFPIGVINLMILFVNKEKQGELPGYNYFEKIANTWARANIKTTKDAIEYINKQQNKKVETKTYQKGKKEVKLPTWYDKYEKQLESLPEANNLSDDEIEKILEEAKKQFA